MNAWDDRNKLIPMVVCVRKMTNKNQYKVTIGVKIQTILLCVCMPFIEWVVIICLVDELLFYFAKNIKKT